MDNEDLADILEAAVPGQMLRLAELSQSHELNPVELDQCLAQLEKQGDVEYRGDGIYRVRRLTEQQEPGER